MNAYRITKAIYRALVPDRMSKRLGLWAGRSAASRLLLRLKSRLEKNVAHDELYDVQYFVRLDEQLPLCARAIAESIEQRFRPVKVLDVGCGTGAIMSAMRDLGIDVLGLELSSAAIKICARKGLSVRRFDLETETDFDEKANIALSTEVAEHLHESSADRYVDLLCGIAHTVVLTAATPGQGGTDHVNEQPNEYWIEKFKRQGYIYLQDITVDMREDWARSGVDRARAKNVMLFERPQAL